MLIRKQQNRFSWFDYRSKGFDDNRGLRIDLLLASQPLAECCVETGIDYEIRSMEKPSDYARLGDLPPLIYQLSWLKLGQEN
ncbi:hypothetical protein ACVXG9_13685 [Escherichia coli]